VVGLRPRNPATKTLGRHRRSPHNALQSPDLDPNAHDPLHRSRYTTSTDMTLVGVGDRTRLTRLTVAVELVLGTREIMRRRLACRRLGVKPGHDHDAAVIRGCGNGRLDLVIRAELEEILIELQQVTSLGGVKLLGWFSRSRTHPGHLSSSDRLLGQSQRVRLTDDSHPWRKHLARRAREMLALMLVGGLVSGRGTARPSVLLPEAAQPIPQPANRDTIRGS